MDITRITEVTDDVMQAISTLLPQLVQNGDMPTKMDIEDIIFQPYSYLLAAKENDKITGMLTLIVYKIPSGKKAWIEDVVVDSKHNGKGIGKQLVLFALDYARKLGLKKIDLTSSTDRIAANKLYSNLGFEKRSTNVYRMQL